MTLLGEFSLWAAALVGLWGAVISFSGRWQGRPDLAATVTRSTHALFFCLVAASLALWRGLISHDFNIEYVAAYTSRNLPPYYIVSAFWAGQKGSLLFWAVVLSLFGSLAQTLTSRRYSDLLPYVAGVTSAVVVFFVGVMLVSANPFERLAFTPPDGRGLNPQLQNVGMVIHPPMLYLGYISITVPFAFAVAALLSRRLDTGWIHAIRKWTLVSWLFLSIGITLGMWWAYVELGWGGYWAWDPVENASLLPWLTMTAFLHSVMIQEKRGMLKRWNLGLIVGTFLLSIFGTFITRSGVISSVHSFTQSNVGYFFLAFLVIAGTFGFTLLYTRWPLLEADSSLDSVVSREAAFLFNNLLLVGIAFSVLWGTLFPILSELVRGNKITVGPPFFNRVNVPLGLLLLGLTGVGPLIAWRKASPENLKRQFLWPGLAGLAALAGLLAAGIRDPYPLVALTLAGFVAGTIIQEFQRGARARMRMHQESLPIALGRLIARNRRRYGGYVVHAAIVLLAIGIAGSSAYDTSHTARLAPGQSLKLRNYTLVYRGLRSTRAQNAVETRATIDVYRGGDRIAVMHPGKNNYPVEQQVSNEVAIRSDWLTGNDTFLIAEQFNKNGTLDLKAIVNPLVNLIWLSGLVFLLGSVVTLWPDAREERRLAVRYGRLAAEH